MASHQVPPEEFSATYARAQAGERAACDVLAREFAEPLQRYVERRSGPDVRRRSAPEDIAQNAMMTFLARLPTFPTTLGERDCLAYLLRIARWQVADVLKRPGRVVGESAAGVFEPVAATPSRGSVTRADDARRLHELIARLHEPYREVLECTVQEGLSIAVTAERLGLRQDAVRKRLARARQELERLLGQRDSQSPR